jgi:hypothetical protein
MSLRPHGQVDAVEPCILDGAPEVAPAQVGKMFGEQAERCRLGGTAGQRHHRRRCRSLHQFASGQHRFLQSVRGCRLQPSVTPDYQLPVPETGS